MGTSTSTIGGLGDAARPLPDDRPRFDVSQRRRARKVLTDIAPEEIAVELFTHGPGNEHPDVIEIEETALVRTLLLESDRDGHVWLEEIDEELNLDISLQAAGVRHHHHIHHSLCRKVEVVVRWNGNHEHTYIPSATIGKVEKWAFGPEVAHFSPEQAATHVLAEPGADHFLDVGVHVGSLAKTGECRVILDMLPRSRFEG